MVLYPFLLAGASISSLIGYYYYLRQRKLFKLFESLEKVDQFDFDYISDLKELPINKTIALIAEIDLETVNLKQSKYNPKRKIVFSEIKKILPREKKLTKQVLSDENEYFDEYYNTITNHNLPKITLKNRMQNELKIEWPNVNEVGLFYIKPIQEKIDPAKIPDVLDESPLEKVYSFILERKKLEYGEIGILPDEKYVYIGEIKNFGSSKTLEINPSQLIFQPKYILGESKDFFVKYLDGQLVKTHKRIKLAFSATLAFGFVHIANFVYSRYISETNNQKKTQKNNSIGKK